jgi:hypothetical protein
MATVEEWSSAYARQADADFNTYQFLEGLPVESLGGRQIPVCHRLQFLQMACEKLVKAHLCARGTPPASLQASHGFISKTLPIVIRGETIATNFRGAAGKNVVTSANRLAREIDLLAPSVRKGGQRPDNCEYPWEDGNGRLHVPLEWTFSSAELISKPGGRSILKVIRSAVDRLMS